MAQGNMLLGMARGSVGDVTFARSARKQVSRARNRKPNNPRTLAQIRQRILLKTAGLAYAVLAKDFADQTFEGSYDARENQQRFMKVNIKLLRDNIATAGWQYASKDDVVCPLNRYKVSEGTLRGDAISPTSVGKFKFYSINGESYSPELTTTYRQFCEAIGIPAGSQLTILLTDGSANNNYKITLVQRARIILAPSDGDLDKAMFGTNFALNDPNPKNEGSFVFFNDVDSFELRVSGPTGSAAAVVSSYDKKWRYSTASLFTMEMPTNNFNDAVESWQKPGSSSDEYTRQAE